MSKKVVPEFWIVTPSFNQAQFIRQTIESVLAQTQVSVRYRVMDGASTDSTVKILKSYGKRISWRSESDKGQTDALNHGLEALMKVAATDQIQPDQIYLAYINSDDFYLPQAFQLVATAFAQHPDRHWLVGDCLIVDQAGNRIQTLIQHYKTMCRRFGLKFILPILNPVPQPAVFFRLSALQKVGLFNDQLRYVMDYEYWWRLLTAVGEPIAVSQPLAAFRIHGASKGGSQYDRQFDEEFLVTRRFVSNPLLLFLHRLHTLIIISIYRLIK